MRQTELSLNKRDRRIVDDFRSKGRHMAREFNRAHILAALDSKVPERRIMEVLNVGRTAIWRTRAAYLEGGLALALHDEPRPGNPRRYAADVEAQVTALACSAPPPGAQRWTVALLTEAARRHPQMKTISRETVRRILKKKKNLLKPWRQLMCCIGELTVEYRRCMYDLPDLYARPYDAREPVICLDEKSKQLLRETRHPLPAKPGIPGKQDYEYERAGTCNIFLAVEPRGQRRTAQVTARRTKIDFVSFVCRMLRQGYCRARKVHLVLNNLNTHARASFEEVLGPKAAAKLLRRIEFHYTPKHASWLNMAEIEIGVLQRQCLARCAAERRALAAEVAAWQRWRNGTWSFRGLLDAAAAYGVRRIVWSNLTLYKRDVRKVPVSESNFDLVIRLCELGARFTVERESMPGRTVIIPPVTMLRHVELLSRDEARDAFGLSRDGRYALFSLGPGNRKDVSGIGRGLIGKWVVMEKPLAETRADFEQFSERRAKLHGRCTLASHAAFGVEMEWFCGDGVPADLPDRGQLESFACRFYNPYFEEGLLLESGRSLGGSWTDSSINALSVIGRLLDIESLQIIDSRMTRVANTGCRQVQGTVDFNFAARGSVGEGCIDTNWTIGRNRKTTLISYKDDGGCYLLEHSGQQVVSLIGKNREVLFACENSLPRLTNDYIGVFADLAMQLDSNEDNFAYCETLHELLYQAEEQCDLGGKAAR